MGRGSKQTFLQRGCTDGPKARKTMLNITNYQRNVNQDYNEVPPYTGQNGICKNSTNITGQRGWGEKEIVPHYWWECKLVQPLQRTKWRFFKKLKIELPYNPAIPIQTAYLEKTITRKDVFKTMFIATLFTIPKTQK